MKHITILVPNGNNNLSSIVGAYKILSRANQYWVATHGFQPYQIELAGLAKKVHFHDELFSVQPHTTISGISNTRLIIIPSLNHEADKALLLNKRIISWLADQYRRGAEIASICTGAFLLAATGLLDNKKCSTHWAFADKLQQDFPLVDVQRDELITDENGIYTNGGAYSFLNLMIYLVEKYFDRTTAIACAKVFQIDIDRKLQSDFIIFNGQKQHTDELVKKAQQFLEQHPHEKISVQDLADRFLVGRRNFDRRFIKATGNTPQEYAQRVKMEAAKKALESGRQTVQEIMYSLGYADHKAFRESFRKITGISPLEYKKKYAKI